MAWGKKTSGADEWVKKLKANDPAFTSLNILTFRSFPEADMISVCEALHTNTRLQELHASGHAVTPRALEAFAAMLGANASLLSLNLGDRNLGDAGLLALEAGLVGNKVLQKLDLENKSLSLSGAQSLARIIASDMPLSSLLVSKNKLCDESLASLAEGFGSPASRSVQCVDLRDNIFGAAGARAFARALASEHCGIVSLMLSGNGGGDGVVELLHALKGNTSLRELDISQFQVSDAGAEALGAMLAENTVLETLHVGSNAITGEGLAHVARGLAANKTLRRLYLEQNALGDDAMSVLAAALGVETSGVRELDVGICGLTHRGLLALLPGAGKLVRLRLFGNKIDSGVSELAASAHWAALGSLKDLDLGGNNMPEGEMEALLSEIVGKSGNLPSLATLGLGGNKVDDTEHFAEVVEQFAVQRPGVHVLWEPK